MAQNHDVATQQADNWQEQINRAQQKIQALEAITKDTEFRHAAVTAQNEQLTKQNDQLLREARDYQAAHDCNRDTLEEWRQEHDAAVRKLNAMTAKYLSQEIIFSGLSNDHRRQLEDQMAKNKQEKTAWALEQRTMEEQMHDADMKLEAVTAELAASQSELAAMSEKHGQTKAEPLAPVLVMDACDMDDFEDVEKILQVAAHTSARCEELEKDLELSKLVVSQLNDQVFACQTETDRITAENNKIFQQLVALEESYKLCKTNVTELTAELDCKKTELDEIDGSLSALFATISKEQGHGSISRIQQLAEMSTAVSDVMSRLGSASEKLNESQERAASDAAAITQLNADVEATSLKLAEVGAELDKSKGSLDQKEQYTVEQRARIEELLQQVLELNQILHEAQKERDGSKTELQQQQQDAAKRESALESAAQEIQDLRTILQDLRAQLDLQAETVRDGLAATERSEKLEARLQETNSELARTQSQLRRAASLQAGAETDRDRIAQQLSSHQHQMKDFEAKNAKLASELLAERTEKNHAITRERDAEDRCRQAEFEHKLLEGVKSQVNGYASTCKVALVKLSSKI